MTSSDTEIVTEVAKELAKKIPLGEALTAPAQQTGQILADILKAIQLALAPIQIAGALQDRLRSFIDRSVRMVPVENRVSPAPQILGPVIEGVRYEPPDTPIDSMFSHLLSSAMNSAHLRDVHPAFPMIIKQISPDEAVLLSALSDRPFPMVTHAELDEKRNLFLPSIVERLDFPRDAVAFPENIQVYIEHMSQLGLVVYGTTNAPEATRSTTGKQTGSRTFGEYQLSQWGRQFVRACTTKNPPL